MKAARLIVKYLWSGIAVGCTSFVIMCLSFSLFGGEEELAMIFDDFTRQALGAVLVGIGCGTPAIVYQFNRPSLFWKTAIHFCIGMGVFYPSAIRLGWIPFFPDNVFYSLLQFLCSCMIFMGIWSCFALYNRSEAARINKRLKEIERENGAGQ